MIISVSRRSDIPAHYAPWFMNRIRAGSVLVRNPMNPRQQRVISLAPDAVDCMVFWSKDPLPLAEHLKQLDSRGYTYYFQFTLTPYGSEIEPGLRNKSDIMDTFRRLCDHVGPHRVIWRYDPILMNSRWDVQAHASAFSAMACELRGYTLRCVISFLDVYARNQGAIDSGAIRPCTAQETAKLAGLLAPAAAANGMEMHTCCEGDALRDYGILPGACIDAELIARITGQSRLSAADKNQRPGCRCAASVDIGMYGGCPSGCVYCYANHGSAAVARRCAAHNAESPLLFGWP